MPCQGSSSPMSGRPGKNSAGPGMPTAFLCIIVPFCRRKVNRPRKGTHLPGIQIPPGRKDLSGGSTKNGMNPPFTPRHVPEGIRTPDTRLRRPLLYPAELQVPDDEKKSRGTAGCIGATGFEPATSRSLTGRSTKLSHAPKRIFRSALFLYHRKYPLSSASERFPYAPGRRRGSPALQEGLLCQFALRKFRQRGESGGIAHR